MKLDENLKHERDFTYRLMVIQALLLGFHAIIRVHVNGMSFNLR